MHQAAGEAALAAHVIRQPNCTPPRMLLGEPGVLLGEPGVLLTLGLGGALGGMLSLPPALGFTLAYSLMWLVSKLENIYSRT